MIFVHDAGVIAPIGETSLAPFSDVIATIAAGGEDAVCEWFASLSRPPVDDVVFRDGDVYLYLFDPDVVAAAGDAILNAVPR